MFKNLPRLIKNLILVMAIVVATAVIFFSVANTSTPIDNTDPVGLIDTTYVDNTRTRELNLYIWHPTNAAGTPEIIELFEDNAVFRGFSAIEDAPISEGRHPLIVLSHGSGGNRANQGWLAVELARHGAIVVAGNHPGSTSRDSAPATNILAWNRPADISFIIDSVLADPKLASYIDPDRIAVIGHSLGGYTALAVGGAQLSLDRFIDYCDEFPENIDCLFYRSGDVDLSQVDRNRYEADHSDERVSAVVSIDPAYARSFQPESLQTMVETLLISAPVSEGSFGDLKVPFLADQLQLGNYYVEMHGSHHFTFLPECKPLGYYVLMAVEADGELLCTEEEGESRTAYHEMTVERIIDFLVLQNILVADLQ